MLRASIRPVVKSSVALLAAIALLQLAGCAATSSGSVPDASSDDTRATNGDAVDGDTIDSATPVGDAHMTDAGGLDSDAPTANVAHVPLLHRATALACAQPRPAGTHYDDCNSFYRDAGNCGSDQDCTVGANGRCNCELFAAVAADGNRCSYDGCASDRDCQGGVCDCRESPAHITWGTQTVCLGGNCRMDSDCGQGGYCSPSPALGCGAQSWSAYYCHTPGDQCVDDADCNQGNAYCAYDTGSSRWVCSTGMCIDG